MWDAPWKNILLFRIDGDGQNRYGTEKILLSCFLSPENCYKFYNSFTLVFKAIILILRNEFAQKTKTDAIKEVKQCNCD